jgi:hypothetical protein
MKSSVKNTIIFLLIAYLFVVIYTIWNHPDRYQWDFNVYYNGALNYSNGLNPYSADNSTQSIGPTNNLNYVYPPITLYLFKVFSKYDYTASYHLFLILKVIAFIVLLVLWYNYLEKRNIYLFYLFCMLGFNATILNDLLAGNISMFEQLILWIGFIALAKNKIIVFGICIIITASFKIVPIIFLLLLLVQKIRHKYVYLILFYAIFLVIIIVSSFVDPILFREFIKNTSLMVDNGIVNPCNMALLSEIRLGINNHLNIFLPPWSTIFAFILLSGVILYYSVKFLLSLLRLSIDDKDIMVLYFAITIYALIAPRFKDYSYIIMILPAFYIIQKIKWQKTFPILLVLLILSGERFIKLPLMDWINGRFWAYYPLILVYLIWGMFLYHISKIRNLNSTNSI